MKLLLTREKPNGEAIAGTLDMDGKFFCYSLERQGFEIPEGTYPVKMAFSPHFGRILPHLKNVPGRSDILIHVGNKPEDSIGCILVGRGRVPGGLATSALCLNDLLVNLLAANKLHEKISITIQRESES